MTQQQAGGNCGPGAECGPLRFLFRPSELKEILCLCNSYVSDVVLVRSQVWVQAVSPPWGASRDVNSITSSFPESLTPSSAAPATSPHGDPSSGPSHPPSSGSPSSPPSWSRLSDRPPGLKTYRSSSRGALRLTIKQESGSRKVVHNSACDVGLKRAHGGQLTNGGGAATTPNGAAEHPSGALPENLPQTAHTPKPSEPPPRDAGPPKLKCYRLDPRARLEQRFNPREDSVLSEHLQSAIDSILELQRLQGPPAAPARAPPGGSPVR